MGRHPTQARKGQAPWHTLVDESGAHFDTAGSLRGGREVFVTMRMPNHMTVGGVDRVDHNIAALGFTPRTNERERKDRSEDLPDD